MLTSQPFRNNKLALQKSVRQTTDSMIIANQLYNAIVILVFRMNIFKNLLNIAKDKSLHLQQKNNIDVVQFLQ